MQSWTNYTMGSIKATSTMDHKIPITESVFKTNKKQATAGRSDSLHRKVLDRKLATLKKRQRLTASYQLVIFLFIWEPCFAFMFLASGNCGMLAFRFSNKRWNVVYMATLVLSFFCALPMMLCACLALIQNDMDSCDEGMETCKGIMTAILSVNIVLAFVEVVIIFTALKISSKVILNMDERNPMNSKAAKDNSPGDDVTSKDSFPPKSSHIYEDNIGCYGISEPAVKDVDFTDLPASNKPPPPPPPPACPSEPFFQNDKSVRTSAGYTIPAPPHLPPISSPSSRFGNVTVSNIDDQCTNGIGYVNTGCTLRDHSDISGYVPMHKSTVMKGRHGEHEKECGDEAEKYIEMKVNADGTGEESVINIQTLNTTEPLTASGNTSPTKQLDNPSIGQRQNKHLSGVQKPRIMPKPPKKRVVPVRNMHGINKGEGAHQQLADTAENTEQNRLATPSTMIAELLHQLQQNGVHVEVIHDYVDPKRNDSISAASQPGSQQNIIPGMSPSPRNLKLVLTSDSPSGICKNVTHPSSSRGQSTENRACTEGKRLRRRVQTQHVGLSAVLPIVGESGGYMPLLKAHSSIGLTEITESRKCNASNKDCNALKGTVCDDKRGNRNHAANVAPSPSVEDSSLHLPMKDDIDQLRINIKSANDQREDEENKGYLVPSVIAAIQSKLGQTSIQTSRRNVGGGILVKKDYAMPFVKTRARSDKISSLGGDPGKNLPMISKRKIRRSRSEPFINQLEGKLSVVSCGGISIDDVNVSTNNRKDDFTQEETDLCDYVELWKSSTYVKS